MRRRILGFIFLILFPAVLSGQFVKRGEFPVEITAGETRFEGGIGIADRDVVVRYGDLTIYCDHAEYNPDSREVIARGNVRIFNDRFAFTADRAIYNLDTKALKLTQFGGEKRPFEIVGDTVYSPDLNSFTIGNGYVTTSDTTNPDYQIRARTMRIYPSNRIIFSNATLFIGRLPVFWFPYVYQSLNEQFSYSLAPGYNSAWGFYVVSLITFPVAEKVSATLHVDLRSSRGPALGLDLVYRAKDQSEGYARLQTYGLNDLNPNYNETALGRQPIGPNRYRLTFKGRTYITSDIAAIANMTLLSDQYMLQDFFPGEFSIDPQPETYFELVKYGEAYTLTALLRYQANAFQETTERLPEISWEVARTPLFNGPLFYEATTSAAWLERAFEFGSPNPNYNTFRFDSFHQLVYPFTPFHWLSVVPRVGVRGTYYDKTGQFVEATPENGLPAGILNVQGDRFRFIYNAGLEASFKLSRAYENVQARWLGLDGLRHIIQPYANFSFVATPTVLPQNILPFDRFTPSTRLPPIDFPEFTSIDSIDRQTILRLGVRNRLLTRRDNSTLDWFDLDTYFDVDFDNPLSQITGSNFSNVFDRLRFTPVPWLSFAVDSQLPLFDRGYTEVNTSLDWTVNPNLYVRLGHRYLYENPNFQDSSDITFAGYLRFNENWGFSIYEDYEMATGIINEQDYAIHRDLSSWTASVGLQARNNGGGKTSIGLILTFTLKDLPRLGLPLDLNVGQALGE